MGQTLHGSIEQQATRDTQTPSALSPRPSNCQPSCRGRNRQVDMAALLLWRPRVLFRDQQCWVAGHCLKVRHQLCLESNLVMWQWRGARRRIRKRLRHWPRCVCRDQDRGDKFCKQPQRHTGMATELPNSASPHVSKVKKSSLRSLSPLFYPTEMVQLPITTSLSLDTTSRLPPSVLSTTPPTVQPRRG